MNSILFITLNNFSLLPVTRFIIQCFTESHTVFTVECGIQGQYHYGSAKSYYLHTFNSTADLNRQSFYVKVKKYIKAGWLIFKTTGRSGKGLIYTPDFQVVFFVSILKKIGLMRNTRLVYHQFELIEPGELPGFSAWVWKRVEQQANKIIDLMVVPEVNRLIYFTGRSKLEAGKTFLLPNSTHPIHGSGVESLPEIPDDVVLVGHIGNVGPDHFIHEYINLVNSLSNDHRFYFITVGRYSPAVISLFQTITNPRFLLVGEVPHASLSRYYHRIDFGLILYSGVNLNFEYCAPNKLYEYLSYGVKVFAHKLKGLASLDIDPNILRLADFHSDSLAADFNRFIQQTQPTRREVKEIFERNFALNSYIAVLKERVSTIEYHR